MRLDESHRLNQSVLNRLRDSQRLGFRPEPLLTPDGHPNPYMEAGSHPEVVQRIWKSLATSLPGNCRALVYGTPALVQPYSGIVLAVAIGTEYAIRIPDRAVDEALKVGCESVHHWADGESTQIQHGSGAGWVFGNWSEIETSWITQQYWDLGTTTS